ncbi:MAG: DUF4124 domain-containing protein [Acidovorax sp.]|uniref:DUF4124 domain-containing protein n=1 Tax=Acidovorax sp. TaxID=1872122 RepID=UPI003919D093
MNMFRFAVCAFALGFLAPAWAINKCIDDKGKVSFQDAPCIGQGEKIEVRPAMKGAAPAQPSPSTSQEGAFGPSWQRKNQLQSQGIPQARAAIERNQRECAATPQEGVAQSGPLRRSLSSGSQFAQEQSANAAKDKAACDARIQELREQLKSLEGELSKL